MATEKSLHNSTRDSLSDSVISRSQQALTERIRSADNYNDAEIQRISELDMSLFPAGFELDEDMSKRFRALSTFSKTDISGYKKISSHRSVIGPVIVFFKRIIWRLLQTQLKEPFLGVQEFSSQMLQSHAEVCVKLSEAEKKLSNI